MTFDDLHDLIEDFEKEIPSKTKIAVEKIIQAEADWRTEVKTLEDFIHIIENVTNGVSSKENLSNQLRKFEMNAANNAWEAESFTSLMEVFEYDQTKTLKEIFEDVILDLKK